MATRSITERIRRRAAARGIGSGPGSGVIDLADPADRREPPVEAVIDEYCTEMPSDQNAVDLFAGEWSSRFPADSGLDGGGTVGLFEDVRIDWMVEQLGGVAGMRILELGPLEGGHAHRLETAHDAAEIVAVEANRRAYLKCLIAKEAFGLTRSRFLLGDFNRYMAGSGERFDLVVASGVLYHMEDPAEHIELLCSVADSVFVWTHYYDRDLIADIGPHVDRKFNESERVVHDGYTHVRYRQEYLEALGWGGFCGAGRESANWLERGDIEGLFGHFGFELAATGFHQPDHPHGPSIAFVARRRS